MFVDDHGKSAPREKSADQLVENLQIVDEAFDICCSEFSLLQSAEKKETVYSFFGCWYTWVSLGDATRFL